VLNLSITHQCYSYLQYFVIAELQTRFCAKFVELFIIYRLIYLLKVQGASQSYYSSQIQLGQFSVHFQVTSILQILMKLHTHNTIDVTDLHKEVYISISVHSQLQIAGTQIMHTLCTMLENKFCSV